MSHFQYFPETDTLSIDLSDKPATGGAMNAGIDGEDGDILFSVDDEGRITNIAIERASVRADLSCIALDERHIVGRGRPTSRSMDEVKNEKADGRITVSRSGGMEARKRDGAMRN